MLRAACAVPEIAGPPLLLIRGKGCRISSGSASGVAGREPHGTTKTRLIHRASVSARTDCVPFVTPLRAHSCFQPTPDIASCRKMRKPTSRTSVGAPTRCAALLLAAMAWPALSFAAGGLVPQHSEELRPALERTSKKIGRAHV